MLNAIPERIIAALLIVASIPVIATAMNTDTIPPVIFNTPDDISVGCEDDYLPVLQDWYDDFGGSRSIDNSGQSQLFCLLSFSEVDSLLLLSSDTICQNGAALDVGWYALDSCNNSSDTLFGRFSIVDDERPTILRAAETVSYFCGIGIIDSLNNWLDTRGGAMATDNCGDTVIWSNFFWNDSEGNSGFVNAGDPNNITIPRTNCSWTVNVSFFVVDPCGNSNVSNAIFSIEGDTIAPQLLIPLPDTSISCSDLPFTLEPVFEDGCDGIVSLSMEDINDQDPDTLVCGHYQYQIQRTWIATDACGNQSSTLQNITIEDKEEPQVEFDNFQLLPCDEDIDNNPDRFLTVMDNCSDYNVSFNDVVILEEACQKVLDRNYVITDVCGNIFAFTQTIQLQDAEAPEISSPAVGITQFCVTGQEITDGFDAWIDNMASSLATDACNGTLAFAVDPEDYQSGDPQSIKNAPPVSLNLNECKSNANREIIIQNVDFIYLDSCDNISFTSASYIVVDTVAPIITQCNQDILITLDSACDTILELPIPLATDGCQLLGDQFLSYSLEIDSDLQLDYQSEATQSISLEVGAHSLLYTVTDCAGNQSSCLQLIEIYEKVAPEITCPEDLTISTLEGSCQGTLVMPQDFTIVENCQNAFENTITSPDEGPGYVSFFFNTELDTFTANNIFIGFMGIDVLGAVSDPVLELVYKGDTDSNNEFFTLLSESGEELDVIQFNEADCDNTTTTSVNLSLSSFIEWAENGTIFFTLSPNEDNTDGINPCVNLTENGHDEISFLKATLRYTDVFPQASLRDENGDPIALPGFRDSLLLDIGTYTIQYNTKDASDNTDSCQFQLVVEDNEAPQMSCFTNDTLIVEPSLLGFTQFREGQFNIDASDNCEIDIVGFEPAQVACELLDSTVDITIIVSDLAGNSNSCVSPLRIIPATLEPQFSSGLCIDDTLQLFANLQLNDPFGLLQYHWTGPGDFESFDENPAREITDQSVGGIYELEVIDVSGCRFYGQVEIELQALNSPDINTETPIICEGESLLLNSTSFTESVNYLWYEGISPNGVLLVITSGPSVQISPTPGDHFYYVDIQGENCNTNASSTLQVTVQTTPVAEILTPFITLCEGDDIIFEAASGSTNTEYLWSGPAGYQSAGQFPQIIENATTSNDGIYSLVINENGCPSDTVRSQVIVFPQPPQPIISGETVFCEGSNFVLSVNNIQAADQYLWFLNGVLTQSQSSNNLIIPAAQVGLSGSWTVQVQDGLCFSDTSAVFSTQVNPEIAIGASNNGPVCESDSVTLNASFIPDAVYLWSSPSGNIFSGRNPVVLAEDGIYGLTVTTVSNCSNSTTTEVDVLTVPQITALSNSSANCMGAGSSIVFVPSVFPPGNYDYHWSGPANFSSSLESPIILNADESANGEYTLQIAESMCFSDPVTTSVDLEVIPEAPEVFLISNTCEDDSLVFQAFTNELVSEYIWNTPKGQIITLENQLIINPVDQSDNGDYSLQILKTRCTSEPSQNISVILEARPDKPLISGPSQVCLNESFSLEVSEIAGAEYSWTGPQGALASTDNILTINNAGTQDEGLYSVIVTVNDCNSDRSNSFEVEIIDLPLAPEFESGELAVCLNGNQLVTICLTEDPTGNDRYLLYDFEQDTVLQSSTNKCFNLSFLDQIFGDQILLSARRQSMGCQSPNSGIFILAIDRLPSEPASFVDSEIYICDQESITLVIDNPEDYELKLLIDDPAVTSQLNGNELMLSNIQNDITMIEVLSSFNSCEEFDSDVIIIIKSDLLIANDDAVIMQYNTPENIDIISNDEFEQEVFIEILDDDGLDIEIGSDGILNIAPGSGTLGQRQVQYQICSQVCLDFCEQAVLTIDIGDDTDCFVGNVLTPNGDGINDFLTIPCLSAGTYPVNEIIIFNQWGATLFEASPYLNNWNAIYKGNELNAGTYFYQLKLNDNRPTLSGFIVVER